MVNGLHYWTEDGREGWVTSGPNGPSITLERAIDIALHEFTKKVPKFTDWQAYSNGEIVARMPTDTGDQP